MAARVVGITSSTRCLTLGLSQVPAALTLAQEFGCQVTALSRSPDRIKTAREQATSSGVNTLIHFDTIDPQRFSLPTDGFDLIVAEGGSLSNIFTNPELGLTQLVPYLAAGGALAVSDLIYALSPPPDAVRDRFPMLWTERRYLAALEAHNLDIQFACWVARRGWRAFIAASGEQRDFWESRDAREGLAYLYVVARK